MAKRMGAETVRHPDGMPYTDLEPERLREWGVASIRPKSYSMPEVVYAAQYGLLPTCRVHNLMGLQDMRIQSLRLVNDKILRSCDGEHAGAREIWRHPDNGCWVPSVELQDGFHSFGEHFDRDQALLAISPAWHYRAYLYAEWSCVFTACYLSQAIAWGNRNGVSEDGAEAQRRAIDEVDSWERDSNAAIAFRHFQETGTTEEMPLVAPPVDDLESLSSLAVKRRCVEQANKSAVALAKSDAVTSVRRFVGNRGGQNSERMVK